MTALVSRLLWLVVSRRVVLRKLFTIFSSAHLVAVLGTVGPGPKSSAGPLFENVLLTKSILQVLLKVCKKISPPEFLENTLH